MATNPFKMFQRWFGEAQRAGISLPEAMALATADPKGRPSVRYMLLKGVDDRGFVFFTNTGSRKGRELRNNPHASAAFYWDPLGRQVRCEGAIESVTVAEADAYWATRPRESQLAAHASQQSAELANRRALLARWRRLSREHDGRVIPRPRGWTGFRILPDKVEFWTMRDHRLHERELFTRTRSGWKRTLLHP